MSMSVNASSNPLYYLQSLLQPGAGSAGAANGTDPLADLLATMSGCEWRPAWHDADADRHRREFGHSALRR